jgi:hypothetical protein
MAQLQQQHMLRQRQVQAQQQALLAQQQGYGGLPMNMPNGVGPGMNPQFAAMRAAPNMRPVNLPQHLQAQQAQAQLGLEQQQQQHAQAQHVSQFAYASPHNRNLP